MIIAYLDEKKITPHTINTENLDLLKKARWIDLLMPTKEEETQIETYLKIDIPTREEMSEIELSSRLYKENGTLFMTATMIAQSDSPNLQQDSVTFVLTKEQLITIRYIEPQAFKLFILQLKKMHMADRSAIAFFVEFLDVTIDRLADILEFVGHRLDDYSKTIFRPADAIDEKLDYKKLMQQIGIGGELNTKTRESLMTFNRLITFFNQNTSTKLDEDDQLRLTTLSKDVIALSDHANFVSNKVNFLLDATLGMVNIEQNNIIKIFSVAAVIFLPPTLIASIYGMNFHVMPELSWKYGYLIAIGLMLLSSWLPYKYFKHRKWL